ncbi:putative Ubiquinol-cytochrome-c reductase complex assembly factor 1 [Hypsibius exemplaris]|uniref:Ubiquinol-cytochrome-c reductase complex assembly factor 1 n=1 Tax=Hypsibius exemplaris TaxID=2072580 RepID=A0A1W0WGR4_HYPEX|nr:putative Ubiquinol-cytochrome-c reductase complex assembly factor 1 [Hypsibius exemplaris]
MIMMSVTVLQRRMPSTVFSRISSLASIYQWKAQQGLICALHTGVLPRWAGTAADQRELFNDCHWRKISHGVSSSVGFPSHRPTGLSVDIRPHPFSTSSRLAAPLPDYSVGDKIMMKLFSPGKRAWFWQKGQALRDQFAFMGKRGKGLSYAATVMFGCCTDPLNHLHFFEVLGLPDTFNSWHKITELHVWMCIVRINKEGYPGKFMRNKIVRAFWKDVDERSSRLGTAAAMNRKKGMGVLGDQFRAALFGYDEGLLLDDKVLAGAIWRHFFAMNCDDPRKIELLVYYVRKQIENLEMQDRHQIMHQGIVRWLPLSQIRD